LGYWLADQVGGVYAFGDARFYGSLPGTGTPEPSRIDDLTSPTDYRATRHKDDRRHHQSSAHIGTNACAGRSTSHVDVEFGHRS